VHTTEITASTTELVRAAAEGDERAWRLMVQRYNGLVWGVVHMYHLPDSDAADVVATTWLQLTQNLKRIPEPEAAGEWLATTAQRESLRVLRWIAREQPAGGLDLLEPANEPEARGGLSARQQQRDDALPLSTLP